MRRVVVESPYRAATLEEILKNEAYAWRCVADCIGRGEAPYAGHLLYPAILNDSDPGEREFGMKMHMKWLLVANAVVVYTDRGISEGMARAIRLAEMNGVPVEHREIDQ